MPPVHHDDDNDTLETPWGVSWKVWLVVTIGLLCLLVMTAYMKNH